MASERTRVWHRLLRAAVLVAIATPLVTLGTAPSVHAATTTDDISPDVTLLAPDGWYDAPIHATLLPDGKVMMWGKAWQSWPATASTPYRSSAWILDPTAIGDPLPTQVTPQTQLTEPLAITGANVGTSTVTDDLFCSGNSLTSDGRVVTTGGTRWLRDTATNAFIEAYGVPYETVFDPTSGTWTREPGNMVGAAASGSTGRWYPTDTRLPDGRILVTAGWAEVRSAQPNRSSEIFDPTTGVSTIATPSGLLPAQVFDDNYTHVWVLPYASSTFDLLEIGMQGNPVYGSTKTPTQFYVSNLIRPVSGSADRSSAMLEIRASNGDLHYANGTILVAGGGYDTVAASHVDVFDPMAKAWRPTIDTGTPRMDPATVVLPDGRVLIINGHDPDGNPGVLRAEYVDPLNGFSLTDGTASMPDQRGYHGVALLLPDGRVLIGGGRDGDTWSSWEKPTIQYYSPDYLTKPRPTILQAPAQVAYNQPFAVFTAGGAPKDAVLVALGSMTHSFDQNQRVVQLPITKVVSSNGKYALATVSPHDGWVAPPGTYMLFVLDGNRVPSVAKMIHLG
jgi:Domain of unknown function (DUF1929)